MTKASLLLVTLISSPVIAADVPVAARIIERGTIVSMADISLADDAKWQSRVIVRDENAIVGRELKRTLNAGEAFRLSDLKSPTLVRRGQVVTLLVKSGGLQIAASARALQDGSVGEYIKTQNTASRTIVEGAVGRDGTVIVEMTGAPRLPDAQ